MANSRDSRDSENPRKPEIHEIPDTIAANISSEERSALPNARWEKYKRLLETFYATKWRERWEKSKKGRAIAKYYP